jgi:ribosomal protein S18 acetylase RimI-like enzyme
MTHDPDPLANPIWHALNGPHRALGSVGSLAGFYEPGITPFGALKEATSEAFAQLAELAGPGRRLAFFTSQPLAIPADWNTEHTEPLDQMACTAIAPPRLPDALLLVELTPADAPEMLALATATEPGPFGLGTIRCGRYVGIRSKETGALVAMTGERLGTAAAVEVSAVCTAASHRGQGLAALLVQTVATGILGRGQKAFLHVRPHNTSARALYEKLGFSKERTIHLSIAHSPG